MLCFVTLFSNCCDILLPMSSNAKNLMNLYRKKERCCLILRLPFCIQDQHYHTEWESHAEERKLRYRVVCSRDGPEGVKRTYVQDLMKEDAQYIWTMLGQQRGPSLSSQVLRTKCPLPSMKLCEV
ncbi:hypothetical protein C8R48DRAFT_453716 [Suillus tomentosus]|nr:hypothetical protein C8R48DRAFT_453716 [Suillus tomentosus]